MLEPILVGVESDVPWGLPNLAFDPGSDLLKAHLVG